MVFRGQRGTYTKTALLGAGSFGNVYAARPSAGASDAVAVKVSKEPTPEEGASAVVAALHDEVAQLRELADTGIVPRLLDHGVREGHPFFVMERLPGSLRSQLPDLSLDQRLACLEALCERVAALHALGRVHRDLKPSNVLVDARAEPPRVLLCDLSTGRALRQSKRSTMSRVGTEDFLPPEAALRVTGDRLGPAWDVYGCALCVYVGVVGELPGRLPVAHPPLGRWEARVPPESVADHLHGTPLSDADRARLREAVGDGPVEEAVATMLLAGLTRALGRDPHGRGTAAELARVVRAAHGALAPPAVARPEVASPTVSAPARRSWAPLAFVVGGAVGAALGVALWPAPPPPEPEVVLVPTPVPAPLEPEVHTFVGPILVDEPARPRVVATPDADVPDRAPVTVRLEGALPHRSFELSCPDGFRQRVSFRDGVGVSDPIGAEACFVKLKGGPLKTVPATAGQALVCADTGDGLILCGDDAPPEEDGPAVGAVTVHLDPMLPHTAIEVTCPEGFRVRSPVRDGTAEVRDVPDDRCRLKLIGGAPFHVGVKPGFVLGCRPVGLDVACTRAD